MSSAVSGYLRFASENRRFVSFGFFVAMASSFGQTYFIGIFGPALQQEFSLSHTAWGSIYMLGTLASAAALPFTGRYIDRIDLARYSVMVCALMILACVFITQISAVWMLVPAIFLLRQSGQGLLSHISVTSMARYFDSHRGRAIAIATLGFAAGEALFPVSAVKAIETFGWRWTYGGVAAIMAIVLIPLVLWLLRGQQQRHAELLKRESTANASADGRTASWTVAEVLRDWRFWLLLPGLTVQSIVITALFFHHLHLADVKGWSHAWLTGSYVIYSISVVVTSLISGPLIDHFGAARLVAFMQVPLVICLLVVGYFDHPMTVWAYLGIMGINVGISHTAVSALWAEIYGVSYLGSIKSLAAAVSVFASALGPVTTGLLLDAGFGLETVCLMFAAYTVVAALALRFTLTAYPKHG